MPMLSDGITPLHYQRRIGERYPIRVGMRWGPTHTPRWPRKVKSSVGTTENVSLTGIGFEASTTPGIRCGSAVRISIGDQACTAAVRSTRPGRTPGQTFYGVEIRDRAMVDAMKRLIANYRLLHEDDASA